MTKKYPFAKIVQMEQELRDAIRWYRNARNLASDSDAVRELLWSGYEGALAKHRARKDKAKRLADVPPGPPKTDLDEDMDGDGEAKG